MNLYDRYVLPRLLNFACGLEPVRRQRDKIVPLARGDVLEVGIGTGRNITHYNGQTVRKLCGLDPATQMQYQEITAKDNV